MNYILAFIIINSYFHRTENDQKSSNLPLKSTTGAEKTRPEIGTKRPYGDCPGGTCKCATFGSNYEITQYILSVISGNELGRFLCCSNEDLNCGVD